LERQLAQHGTCRLFLPVFDGSGLYNLRFGDVNPTSPIRALLRI